MQYASPRVCVLCPMCGVSVYVFLLCLVAGSSLLWQVFKVRLHAVQCVSVCLYVCVFVCVRAGAKSIVDNLWVWSAVDINSHFSVYC